MQSRVTLRCDLEHQVLKVAPLSVQSLHQLEGVDRVSQEALGVQGGRGGHRVQLLCPTRGRERGEERKRERGEERKEERD